MEMLNRMTRLDFIAVACVFSAGFFAIAMAFHIYENDLEVTFNLIFNFSILLIPQTILGVSKLLHLIERKEDG